jgi:TonB family protein
MNAANYLIEVNAALLLLAAGYWLLLRNEDDFRMKRAYLVGALIVSLIAPLFSWSAPIDAVPTLTQILPAYWLPELTITSDGAVPVVPTTPAEGGWKWVETMYWMGVALAALFLVYRVANILKLRLTGGVHRWRGYRVVQSPALHSTFSFAGTIYLAQNKSVNEPEAQLMLQHEVAHIDKLHSYDILLTQVIGLFCWFNPIMRWYRQELSQQHEFEADATVAAHATTDAYVHLLAEEALQQAGFSLAHHFNSSFTLKRIAMLQKLGSRLALWKWPVIALVSAIAIAFVSCQDQLADLKVATENSTVALTWPREVQEKLEQLKAQQPDAQFSVYEMNEEGKRAFDKVDSRDVTQVHMMVLPQESKDAGRNFVILQQGGMASQLGDFSADPNMVFTVVEETATPKEGIESFYRYIAANLRYPVQARREGVEGKVYVEFIVNTDGTLSDARVVRGIGGGCDEEAVRVLAGSPEWNPGKQKGVAVKQKMVLPIVFKLGSSDKKIDAGTTGPGMMPEVVAVGYPPSESFVVALSKKNEPGGNVLTGTVRNKKDEPLMGVNVLVAGTTTGTVTDSQGKFLLRTTTDRGNLVISFVGYQTQTVSF